MKKSIPLGVMDFEDLMKNNYYFVDKTLMIQEFLERKTKVTLVTRPRRFGKTLNMSMLASFFDITKDSSELFMDTKIMHTEYAKFMNMYPTIFISFANAKNNKEDVVEAIKLQLRKEYDRYSDVFKEDMTVFDQNTYHTIVQGLVTKDDGILNNVSDALSFLMERLEKYYNKKVIVLIDEYDTPFIEAHVNGYYDEIRGGLSSILHNALKTSTSLQYAMLTGIQRVAKENIFSGLNNLVVCTVVDLEYSQYFGFTQEETSDVLRYYGLSLNDEVKAMYDGYRFGDQEIYNPWSILNYASRKRLEPYWINTSGNSMIKKAMAHCDPAFSKGYEELIQNGILETKVKLDTSFYEINSTASLWGLLLNAGYLTVDSIDARLRSRYVLRIPNKEVQEEFQNLTSYYLNVSDETLDDMFEGLLVGDQEMFVQSYRQILLTLPSYHDLKDENSYHMMLLGMCAWLSNEYDIMSNREVGEGRCDIILKSKCEDLHSYILEFKYSKVKTDLKALAQSAVDQIKTRKYDAGLDRVVYIGLAHYLKDVEIVWSI